MNPLPLLIAAIAIAAASGWAGWQACSDHRDALALAEAQGKAQALEATAQAIARIEVKNVTIRQQAETIVREKTVYQDCRNTPEMVQLLNAAAKGGAQ